MVCRHTEEVRGRFINKQEKKNVSQETHVHLFTGHKVMLRAAVKPNEVCVCVCLCFSSRQCVTVLCPSVCVLLDLESSVCVCVHVYNNSHLAVL